MLRLLSLNYMWCLERNLNVVLSLNDVKTNIVINYWIRLLNNGRYKNFSIVNNRFFIKENPPYVSFPSKRNLLMESCVPCLKEGFDSGIVKLIPAREFNVTNKVITNYL